MREKEREREGGGININMMIEGGDTKHEKEIAVTVTL